MGLTKGFVLSNAEFRGLVIDLIEEWREVREDFDGTLEEWLEGWFEELLDMEKMDLMMVYDGREWVEIYTGEDFVEFLRREGRLKDFDESYGGRGRLLRRRKR